MAETKVITLGCRLNVFESEVMRGFGEAANLKDTVIVNTCAVTAEAGRQARQTVRKLHRDNPSARIVVTGCAAQLDPEDFASMDGVEKVLGNEEKMDPIHLTAFEGEKIEVSDIMAVRETAPHLVSGFDEHTRAFVQIQQGCDHRCTFCIIPFARGNNRSIGAGRIAEQVRTLVDAGYREVVLTGVDICSYGSDLPGTPSLGDLCFRLLKAVPGLRRLRLSSLDPAAIDDKLFDLIASEPRLMPHLHLSLQAMDDMVLKRMKRRHTRQQACDVVKRVRDLRPDAVFGADLIAGFPTETDEMFENTLNAVEELELTWLHVFPYSERPGTPAAKMPVVPGNIRKQRASKLRAAGEKILIRFLNSQIGETVQVLLEKNRRGLSQHYAPVEVDFEATPGDIIAVKINEVCGGRLMGSPIR